jgi:arsenate reductase
MKTVLFACVHNAGRSQMAAAFFNRFADPVLARAISAGTQPGPAVYPGIIEVMREVEVELDGAPPRLLTPEIARQAALLVTMGCGEACPVVPGAKRDDWPLEDPQGKPLPRVREIRDAIRQNVSALIKSEGWARRTA